MSTKIYNGIRINGEHSFGAIQKLANDLSTLIEPMAYDLQIRHLARSIASKTDHAAMTGRPAQGDPLTKELLELIDRQEQIRAKNRRDQETDYGCEILFVPLDNRPYMLGVVYTEQPRFMKAVLGHTLITEYGYWDNTDRPGALSESEWARREADWSVIGSRPACCYGFLRTISTNTDVRWPSKDDVLAAIPDFETRVSRVARLVMLERRVKQNCGDDCAASSAVRAAQKAMDWAASAEGEKEMARTQKRARKCLAKHISLG